MKIYTQTYDLAKASPHRFWVAPFSEFKIGIKILEKGEISAKDFTLKAGSIEFTPDPDKIDNFTLFTIKSNDTGFVDYTIEVEGVAEKLKLMQIVTDSTVFEIDASGGDVPADVATQTWVNSQISDFITEDALTAYVPLTGNVNMTGSLSVSTNSNGVELDSSNGVTVWDIDEGKRKAISLDYDGLFVKDYNDSAAKEIEYPTKSGTMVVDTDLTAYYTKSETSSAIELADAFAGAGGGAVSAYALSDSPIQSETLIRQALVDNTCLPQTIALNKNGTIEIFDVEGTLNLHQESPSFISLIPDAVKVLVGTKVTNLAGRCFWGANKCKDIVLPNSLSGIIAGSSTGEVFTGVPAKRLAIPDSVTTFGNGNVFWNWQQGEVVDFGNTRLTIPTGGSFGTNSPTVKYIVPDSLYSQWITTGNWANVSAQVFPHSQMPGAVTGSAYAGTTGTPAAITNMQTVYETDWATLSASALSSTFYVVVPDPE